MEQQGLEKMQLLKLHAPALGNAKMSGHMYFDAISGPAAPCLSYRIGHLK